METTFTNLLELHSRTELREWLQLFHTSERECWVVTYRSKAAPQYPAIPYTEVVEEALCFGWIDSFIRRLTDGRVVQRISPRRKNSSFSKLNEERYHDLMKRGLMTTAGHDAYMHWKGKTINTDITTH